MAQQVRRLDRYGRELSDDSTSSPTVDASCRVAIHGPSVAEMRRALSLMDGGVASRVFRTFVQATASVCMTCG